MEQKILVSMIAPISTRSGYGARARDIARAILSSDKFELKIWPINWGNTPFYGLDPNDPMDNKIKECIMQNPDLPKQPDIHIHISVPSEFQPVGKYNIGMTAGIETDHVDPSWLEGANRMHLLVVSSEHAKTGFTNTMYHQRRDNNPNSPIINELKLNIPVEVLFEGADLTKFFKRDDYATDSILNTIPEKFNFLFVGHWLQGDLGQDRKDVGMLIKTFFETFKNKKEAPGLILKTSQVTNSYTDRKTVLEKIDAIRKTCNPKDELPNVYLLHGNLSDSQMNDLYNHPKVKAHISFTKGEGFGRPILEASISAKPVIIPKYSGYVDFMEHAVFLPFQLTPIHPSAQWQGVLNAGTSWATVDYRSASGIMRDVYEHYDKYKEVGKRQAYRSRTMFNLDEMTKKLLSILDAGYDNIPKPVPLKLPKLKKIELPKLDVPVKPDPVSVNEGANDGVNTK
jgi:glycosyltransferase involved in cell wall biosynthesis